MAELFPFAQYWWFYGTFTAGVIVLLALDLGLAHRRPHVMAFKEAVAWSVFFIALAMLFALFLSQFCLWEFPKNPSLAGLDHAELALIQAEVRKVRVSDALVDYVLRLVDATRSQPQFALGLSPRASLALLAAARAWALLAGRDYVIPEDVQAVLPAVAGHRLRERADPSGHGGGALVQWLLREVPAL
jgi:hypothetical protein